MFFCKSFLLNILSRVWFCTLCTGECAKRRPVFFCNSYILVHIFQFILHTHTQDVIMDLKYIPSIRVYTTFSYIYMNIYVIPFKLFNEKNIYIYFELLLLLSYFFEHAISVYIFIYILIYLL